MKRLLLLALVPLCGCAGMAHLLGAASDQDLQATIKTVHEVGSIFGPAGTGIATIVSAGLVGLHEVYRNKTRKKALAAHKP